MDEAAAHEWFEQGRYDFSHIDAANVVREGAIELDAEEVTIEYRAQDGRRYRVIYQKRDLAVDRH